MAGKVRQLLAICCLLPSTHVSAADWPQFRGPTGQGISTDEGLPTHWDTTKNVAWKTAIPGKGWSSPVVVADRVYLTTAVPEGPGEGADLSLRALCLDAVTGELLWSTEAFPLPAADIGPVHSKNSHASPTPVVDAGRLYVHFGTHGTACLDLEGGVVWRNHDLEYSPVHGSGASPVLVGDLLIVNCDGANDPFLIALDRETGEQRWRENRPTSTGKLFSFCTGLLIEVDGQQQLVSPAANMVSAYDPADGSEIWRITYDGYSVVPRPLFGHGLIFMSTGYANFGTPQILAIRPNGSGDVTKSHVAWRARTAAPLNPSLLLVGDELYAVSDQGVASCFDAKTGKVHWRQRLGGNFSASPVYGDGKVYFQSEEGDATVIRAGREYSLLAKNSFGEPTLASYAVSDSALFVRTLSSLYRIEEK